MKPKKITEGIFWVGAVDWDRRLFDALIPLPDGTSYNAYLVKGSEKTALLDTVEPSKKDVLLKRLEGVDRVDYVISHHSEQDHSGAIPEILEKYPEARVVTMVKGKELLVEHLGIDPERVSIVSDGETLSLGDKTIEFISTPWVHWPETMSTYIKEDRILFTCDLFGSHFAQSGLFAEDDAVVCDAAKRYYAEVMMPFRAMIKKHIERFEGLQVDIIAPSHGPVHKKPHTACIIGSHKEWVSDRVANTVVIPYATMHGSTERMVERLTETLSDKGIKVERFNLASADTGKLGMAMVDAATVVFGTPTVLTGAHPLVVSAAFLINALKPKVRYASVIGSYGWGGKALEQIASMTSGLKAEVLEPVMVKGAPKQDDLEKIDGLAARIEEKHRELDLL